VLAGLVSLKKQGKNRHAQWAKNEKKVAKEVAAIEEWIKEREKLIDSLETSCTESDSEKIVIFPHTKYTYCLNSTKVIEITLDNLNLITSRMDALFNLIENGKNAKKRFDAYSMIIGFNWEEKFIDDVLNRTQNATTPFMTTVSTTSLASTFEPTTYQI
jgi:hypothetical protein